MRKTLLYIILLILSFNNLIAQQKTEKELFVDAEYAFFNEQFYTALPIYIELLKIDSTNANINYKIGMCLLHLPNTWEKTTSIPYLEKAAKKVTLSYKSGSYKEKNAPDEALFYLGNAYRYAHEFDKAIDTYEKFKTYLTLDDVFYRDYVEREMLACNNAKELIKYPVDIVIENVGSNIKSNEEIENCPVMSADQSVLVYTAGKNSSINPFIDLASMNADYKLDNIYYIKKTNGVWSKPINITDQLKANSKTAPACITADGTELFLVRDDNDNGNVYMSEIKNNNWSPMKKLNKNINTKSWESHATITKDGKTLYFTSDREGGYGGLDIYKSNRDEKGEWGPAINLGPSINTPYDEETPAILDDGKTLYFSSLGHYGMGGFDVFYSTLLEGEQWTEPINVGYPINTVSHDLFHLLKFNGVYAFFPLNNSERDIEEKNTIFKLRSQLPESYFADLAKDSINNQNKIKEESKEITNNVVAYIEPVKEEIKEEPIKEIEPEIKKEEPVKEEIKKETVVENNIKEEPIKIIEPEIKKEEIKKEENLVVKKDSTPEIKKEEPIKEVIKKEIVEQIADNNIKKEEPIKELKKEEIKKEEPKKEVKKEEVKKEPKKIEQYIPPVKITEINLKGKITTQDRKSELPKDLKVALVNTNTQDTINLNANLQTGDYSQITKHGDFKLIYTAEGYQPQIKNISIPENYSRKDYVVNADLIPLEVSSGEYYVIKNVYFDFDNASVRLDAKIEIERIYQLMTQNPSLFIEVIGHTDSKGDDNYNNKLSEKRSRSVIDYLVEKGISSERFVSKGLGKAQHIAINQNPDGTDNPEGRQLNRRVEMKVLRGTENVMVVYNLSIPKNLRYSRGFKESNDLKTKTKANNIANNPSSNNKSEIIDKVKFTILLLKQKNKLENNDFKKVKIYQAKDEFIYTMGEFEKSSDAVKLLNTINEFGFPDARIISTDELYEMIDDSTKVRPGEIIAPRNLENTVYTIQLTALRKPVEKGYFKNLKDVKESLEENGIYKYTYKEFKNYNEAKEEQIKVKNLGYIDAYITTTEITDNNIYTIQLAALKKPTNTANFKNLKEVDVHLGKDGYYRYTFGKFKKLELAKKEWQKLIDLGYTDAFIMNYDKYK